ncbi:MAG TPA: hypothetical protein VK666_26615, partial [Chryseolinea sp.]|nr:hypothetical protein [Chryseolinea sp.]
MLYSFTVAAYNSINERRNTPPNIIGPNVPPRITGQVPLVINQGQSFSINLGYVIVTDPDSSFPADFALQVLPGNNYTVNNNVIMPAGNFWGPLTVLVTVTDGYNTSSPYGLRISVLKGQNKEPTITGQSALSMKRGTNLTIDLNNLQVSDEDNSYPTDFTMKIYGGSNYTVNGTTITPSFNFAGTLKVPVTVNDGEIDSKRFDLKVDVLENAVPQITGQSALTVMQGSPITISLSNLQVADPDNNYPADFTLKLFTGNNYTISGNTITPGAGFSGNMLVPVIVNDGMSESNPFDLKINVTVPNVAPIITGQLPLNITQGGAITVDLSKLLVTDTDNAYPTGFSLTLYPGVNYTISGNTVTPTPAFAGSLTVPVTVNDGKAESNRFNLRIDVIHQNIAPQITSQSALSVMQGSAITISLTNLQVTDPDNIYPADFTIKLFTGSNYTVSGNTITPGAGFSGNLLVPVTVNDGKSESNRFNMKIGVTIPNVAPTITGQLPLNVNPAGTLTVDLSKLLVTDTDNAYPT